MPKSYGQVKGRAYREPQPLAPPRGPRAPEPEPRGRTGHAIEVAVDGVAYPSITLAAKAAGISRYAADRALRDGRPRNGHKLALLEPGAPEGMPE